MPACQAAAGPDLSFETRWKGHGESKRNENDGTGFDHDGLLDGCMEIHSGRLGRLVCRESCQVIETLD